MIVVDSSGWIEFLQHTERAALFQPALADPGEVIVPSIALFEVYRLILSKQGSRPAQAAVAHMQRSPVADLTPALAVAAASLAHLHKLSAADAIIYATAQSANAELWSQDAHFKSLPGVRYFPKP